MGTQIYIEADPDEDWRAISRPFCEWLQVQTQLEGFGISEATPPYHEVHGIRLLGVFFNENNAAYAGYLKEWARLHSRVWAEASNGKLVFSNGASAIVPETPNIELPPWLR